MPYRHSHRHRISLAVSYIVLAGTGAYCLFQTKDQPLFCPHVTFGIITAHSLVGAWRWGLEQGHDFDDLHNFLTYCQVLFALPCMTTTVWLANGYQRELSWAWALVPIFPLICYIVKADLDSTVIELMIFMNVVGLGVVSFLAENNYGVAAAVSYTIVHFYIRHADLSNYALCFFAYFSLRTIGFGGF